MKKVLMLVAVILGTTVMVNAQDATKAAPAKEVKAVKSHKKMEKKAVVKADGTKTEATKVESSTTAKPAAKK